MKNCPICSGLFECYPKGPCWCEDIPRSSGYTDFCVCLDCLQDKKKSFPKHLAPRQGQRPALPFQRGRGLGFLKKKDSTE